MKALTHTIDIDLDVRAERMNSLIAMAQQIQAFSLLKNGHDADFSFGESLLSVFKRWLVIRRKLHALLIVSAPLNRVDSVKPSHRSGNGFTCMVYLEALIQLAAIGDGKMPFLLRGSLSESERRSAHTLHRKF